MSLFRNRLAALFHHQQPKPKPLPPLLVEITEPGHDPRLIELPDPRTDFCKELNEQGRPFGVVARPIRVRKGGRHA